MGFASLGEPLSWDETKKHSAQARRKGIEQFIRLFSLHKDRTDDPFKFGDEVEFSLVKFDHKQKRVFLLRRGHELLKQLQCQPDSNQDCEWSPEFANYMLEAMPSRPYDAELTSLLKIEPNMRKRREEVQRFLEPNEAIMTFSTFPLIGSPDFLWPRAHLRPTVGFTSSLFMPDDAIYPDNLRYAYAVLHTRLRRRVPRPIHVPIYRDHNTPRPFQDDLSPFGPELARSKKIRPEHIFLENIGASCSCLQVTFQARNLSQAKFLYDQLIPIAPIVLAMTASSPIWRGYLTEIDVRWRVISESLDDRTPEEVGDVPLKTDRYRQPKPRYDSVDCYLSESSELFNDVVVSQDEEFFAQLVNNGVDRLLAQHVAHLFTRDPLVLYGESLLSGEDKTDLFDNIQSMNWQSVRFKPPPGGSAESGTGWRVEFRTAELQISDFENAAFVVFLSLLVRSILAPCGDQVDFRVPISLVDENMRRAQNRDACLREKFHFKTSDGSVSELTINEIINGTDRFAGLISLIRHYLAQEVVDIKTMRKIMDYLTLVGDKASGKVPTTASLMRSLVRSNPNYKMDSVVSNEVAYETMLQLHEIANQIL